jgi:pimeloyl-ACP methyl ester carboxylesterase
VSEGLELKVPDGRLVTYDTCGDERGWPVFLLHGAPGSRLGPRPRGSVLYRLGVRLISHDRPGYGGSTRFMGRTVADVAEDVRHLADALGIDHFSVVGRSGGGPHALACAALLPERVVRTAVLVSFAPADAAGLNWFAGMAESNTQEFGMVEDDPATLTERLRLRADQALADPETFVEFLLTQMPDSHPDRPLANAVVFRRLFAQTYREALKDGPYGWVDDTVALRANWGFRLEDVRGSARLWHGANDRFTPPDHSRWLASRIPNAEVQVQENAAHFGAMEILPDILGWLAAARHDLVGTRPRTDAGR